MKNVRLSIIISLLFIAAISLNSISVLGEESTGTDIPFDSSTLVGKPAITAGAGIEYYIWKTGDIITLRWTSDGKEHTFHGNITSDAKLTNIVRINTEGKDYIAVTNKRVIAFSTTTTTSIEGFSFRINGPEWVKIALRVDGELIDVGQINLGNGKANPGGNPMLLGDE